MTTPPAAIAERTAELLFLALPAECEPFVIRVAKGDREIELTYRPTGFERPLPLDLNHAERLVYDCLGAAQRPMTYREVHAELRRAGWPYCLGYVKQLLTDLRRYGWAGNNEDKRGFFRPDVMPQGSLRYARPE